jgi:membrane protease YdiL (CAAX protease family)
MNDATPNTETPNGTLLSRPRPLRDILIVGSPVIALGAAGNAIGLGTLLGGAIVNLGYVLMILVGAVVLGRQNSSWRRIGLGRPASWPKTAMLGVGAFLGAIVVFVAMQTLGATALAALGVDLPDIDQSRFLQLEGNLPLFRLLVSLAWTTIAFGEELFYRAFLITRMVDHTRIGRWTAILVAGSVFGLVHFAEGALGVLSNGAFGVLFGWIFLRSGRNLWITIVGHGLLNTLRFTFLYLGAA